jgi:hypothetical protein
MSVDIVFRSGYRKICEYKKNYRHLEPYIEEFLECLRICIGERRVIRYFELFVREPEFQSGTA